MDLFSEGLTDNQRLNNIKERYKTLLNVDQNGKGKFTLIKGFKKHFGNCILFILPNVTSHGFMNADFEKEQLILTLDEYGIENYIICYAQPSKAHSSSRQLIKKSREIMFELIDVINPKLIITFDSNSAELFMNMKPNIIEQHGTIVTSYFTLPVILTYDMSYYSKRTGYEDDVYKLDILHEDWNVISEQYKKLIKE